MFVFYAGWLVCFCPVMYIDVFKWHLYLRLNKALFYHLILLFIII